MSPIADSSGWSLLDGGATLSGSGRLEVLDRDECRRLLGSSNIGRLAYIARIVICLAYGG